MTSSLRTPRPASAAANAITQQALTPIHLLQPVSDLFSGDKPTDEMDARKRWEKRAGNAKKREESEQKQSDTGDEDESVAVREARERSRETVGKAVADAARAAKPVTDKVLPPIQDAMNRASSDRKGTDTPRDLDWARDKPPFLSGQGELAKDPVVKELMKGLNQGIAWSLTNLPAPTQQGGGDGGPTEFDDPPPVLKELPDAVAGAESSIERGLKTAAEETTKTKIPNPRHMGDETFDPVAEGSRIGDRAARASNWDPGGMIGAGQTTHGGVDVGGRADNTFTADNLPWVDEGGPVDKRAGGHGDEGGMGKDTHGVYSIGGSRDEEPEPPNLWITCTFTVDDFVEVVYLNGYNATSMVESEHANLAEALGNARIPKTIRFQMPEDGSPTTLAIMGRNDCYDGDGKDYDGDIAITRSGRTCQQWSSDTPHQHRFHAPRFDFSGNKCRNPDRQKGPWCYTTDRKQRWELCNINQCKERRSWRHRRTGGLMLACKSDDLLRTCSKRDNRHMPGCKAAGAWNRVKSEVASHWRAVKALSVDDPPRYAKEGKNWYEPAYDDSTWTSARPVYDTRAAKAARLPVNAATNGIGQEAVRVWKNAPVVLFRLTEPSVHCRLTLNGGIRQIYFNEKRVTNNLISDRGKFDRGRWKMAKSLSFVPPPENVPATLAIAAYGAPIRGDRRTTILLMTCQSDMHSHWNGVISERAKSRWKVYGSEDRTVWPRKYAVPWYSLSFDDSEFLAVPRFWHPPEMSCAIPDWTKWRRIRHVQNSMAGAEECAATCTRAGLRYFGLECPMSWGVSCKCANVLDGSKPLPPEFCGNGGRHRSSCNGPFVQGHFLMGGANRMSVYFSNPAEPEQRRYHHVIQRRRRRRWTSTRGDSSGNSTNRSRESSRAHVESLANLVDLSDLYSDTEATVNVSSDTDTLNTSEVGDLGSGDSEEEGLDDEAAALFDDGDSGSGMEGEDDWDSEDDEDEDDEDRSSEDGEDLSKAIYDEEQDEEDSSQEYLSTFLPHTVLHDGDGQHATDSPMRNVSLLSGSLLPSSLGNATSHLMTLERRRRRRRGSWRGRRRKAMTCARVSRSSWKIIGFVDNSETGAENCAVKCLDYGFKYFGLECPSQQRVVCQCSGTLRGTTRLPSFFCRNRIRHNTKCVGPYFQGEYLMGSHGTSAVYYTRPRKPYHCNPNSRSKGCGLSGLAMAPEQAWLGHSYTFFRLSEPSVTCKFTVDDAVEQVYFDERDVTNHVQGTRRDLSSTKELTFSPPAWGRDTTLAIKGLDFQKGKRDTAGLMLACRTDIWPTWAGLTSMPNSDDWLVTGDDKPEAPIKWYTNGEVPDLSDASKDDYNKMPKVWDRPKQSEAAFHAEGIGTSSYGMRPVKIWAPEGRHAWFRASLPPFPPPPAPPIGKHESMFYSRDMACTECVDDHMCLLTVCRVGLCRGSSLDTTEPINNVVGGPIKEWNDRGPIDVAPPRNGYCQCCDGEEDCPAHFEVCTEADGMKESSQATVKEEKTNGEQQGGHRRRQEQEQEQEQEQGQEEGAEGAA